MTAKLILPILLGIICLGSCQRKVIYAGDDSVNSSPFKKNLVKKDGQWQVNREEQYFTDNNQRDYLGYKEAVLHGVMTFTEDEPSTSIAGSMGRWNPVDGDEIDILYQVSAENTIQIAIYEWIDNKTAGHMGYTAHLDWDRDNMVWEGHDYDHRGDTLVKYWYYFTRLK